MNNVIKFPSQAKRMHKEVRMQACLWLTRLEEGASEEDYVSMRHWLDQDPAHIAALFDAAYVWDQTNILAELSEIFPLEEYIKPRNQTWKKRLIISAAASFLLVAIICLHAFSSSISRMDSNMLSIYETAVGEQKTVILPDHSAVVLNTDTRIELLFSDNERKIILHRGEAHFSVTKDANRAFLVDAGAGLVEAVGTAFSIQRTQQEAAEVTVTEGKVNVYRKPPIDASDSKKIDGQADSYKTTASNKSATGLIAGESANISRQLETIEKRTMQPGEMENRLAWRYGMIFFQGDSLDQAIQEISRYTNVKFEIDDNVRKIQVAGYFRTGDIENLLLTMSETFQIKIEKKPGNTIHLSAK